MVKHFLEEGIQTKIIAISLGMFGDGETLERSIEFVLNVYERPKNSP